MPTPRSFADLFTDAEKLLAAAEANADKLPGIDEAKAKLDQTKAEIRDLSVRRDTLNADKQALSQQLHDAMNRVRDLSVELRGLIRSKLGIRNEKLVEFKVAPRRRGIRRSKGKTPTPVPTPSPAPEPGPNPTPDPGSGPVASG